MGGFSTLGGGIKKLSDLIIDADKDWSHKKIQNTYFEFTELPTHDCLINVKKKYYEISDEVYAAHDATAETTSGTYTLLKEFTLPPDFPANTTLRIYFVLYADSSGRPVYARIYRNGSPVGTERETRYSLGVAFTEDIPGWNPGDKVQLYARNSFGSDTAGVKNFRILGSSFKLPLASNSDNPVTIIFDKYDIQITYP